MMLLFLSLGTGHGAGDEAKLYLSYGGTSQNTVRRQFSTPATVSRPGEQSTTNHRAHRPRQKSQGPLYFDSHHSLCTPLTMGTVQL